MVGMLKTSVKVSEKFTAKYIVPKITKAGKQEHIVIMEYMNDTHAVEDFQFDTLFIHF